MDYLESVRKVAEAHREEIEGDLDRARHELMASRQHGEGMERRVREYETLLALLDGSPSSAKEDPGGLTLHDAMAEVLHSSPGHMRRAADLAAEINRRRLYRMKDGRPVEPQQIHARVGHYSHLFAREGTFIKLADA